MSTELERAIAKIQALEERGTWPAQSVSRVAVLEILEDYKRHETTDRALDKAQLLTEFLQTLLKLANSNTGTVLTSTLTHHFLQLISQVQTGNK